MTSARTSDCLDDSVLNGLRDWCAMRPVKLCVLFGSQATGRARADSDVDLAIWADEAPDFRTRMRWLGELVDLTGREVSLVFVTADTNPVLGWEIVRNGLPVFEREPGLWRHHWVQRWHVYNDALPFRRAQAEALRKFAEEHQYGAGSDQA